MRNRLRALRTILCIFFAFLILFETMAYIATTPRPQESFFQFYALGASRMANDYYPNNSAFIQLGEQVTWFIGVRNQMGSIQYVDIRVKLANQTINPPNDTTATPSTAPLVVEFQRFLQDNETWEFPFTWQVLNFTASQSRSHIFELQIGDSTYHMPDGPTCSASVCRLRFIFELWTWNVDTGDFQLGWSDGGQERIAWLQLWFTVALGVP
jgi:hypothetical protein